MKGTDESNRRGRSQPTQDGLLTTSELAAMLRLSRVGVWRIAKSDKGFPRAVIMGRNQKRWFRHEVDEWLRAQPRSAT